MGYLVRLAFIVGAATLFAGCGGLQPPGAVPLEAARKATGSNGDLIYVATTRSVVMVSYPQGQIVGSIPWYALPSGVICSDPNTGNVFIPENNAIYAYVYGATTPFSILALPTGYAGSGGCAVDPTSGNLAASLYGSSSKGSISAVAIYPNGSGTPAIYSDKRVLFFGYPAYDGAGDLFVRTDMQRGLPHIAELKTGKSGFIFIKVHNFSGVKLQWDGTYLDFSTTYGSGPGTAIDQVQINGKTGTVVNSIQLNKSRGGPLYFWIQSGAVFSQLHKIRKNNNEGVGVWAYPDGGDPTAQFFGMTKGEKDNMLDLTVSVTPSR